MSNWLPADQDPRRTDGPSVGERATYVDYLRHYRLTLQLKCEGLTAEQLATRSVPPSTLSLLGLLRHMAKVEHFWFRMVLGTDPGPRLFVNDEDFHGAFPDQQVVDEAWALWRREVAHAETVAAEVDLDATFPHHDGDVAARDVLVHMIEEYARHCGHADLLRECVDGRTGQ